MMNNSEIVRVLFLCLLIGTVAACTPAPGTTQTYTTNTGKVLYLENDQESCTRSCNASYDRCGESRAASSQVGRGQFTGVFGGEADCRETLRSCLKMCKAQ